MKTLFGPSICVNYLDNVERSIACGTYEKKYIDFFCSRIREGDVVVDAGAYIGIFSLLASERVGARGLIYAFEPVPRNYDRFLRNMRINHTENIRANNYGLSDREETSTVAIPVGIPSEASLSSKSVTEIFGKHELSKKTVTCKFVPLDNLPLTQKINKVKIDVEGAEMKVLLGMKNTLMNSNNIELFLETHLPLMERMGNSSTELFEFLKLCGFSSLYFVESNLKMETVKLIGLLQDGFVIDSLPAHLFTYKRLNEGMK